MRRSQRIKTCRDNMKKVKRLIPNVNFVCGTSLNVRRGSSEQIWPLRGFFTVSMINVLADLHPL